MSAFGLEGAPYLFSQTGTFPAPYTFTVPATLEVRTDMASASFDGSGASGAFLPAISFYSPSGVRLGTFPCQGTPLAMGDSAEVTWFPLGLAASSAAAPGGGIQFDTDNEGGYLTVAANNAQPFSNPPFYGHSTSLELMDTDNGMFIHADAGSGVAIGAYSSTPPSPAINPGGGGLQFESQHGGTTFLADEWSVTSASDIAMSAVGQVQITTSGTDQEIQLDASGQITLFASSNMLLTTTAALDVNTTNATLWTAQDDIRVNVDGNFVVQLVSPGERLLVFDHNGSPIFAVNENGQLHGKTGASLTFDL